MAEQNHSYETPDFNLAIYLHSSGVPFRNLKWLPPTSPNSKPQAVFVFDEPQPEILLAWMKETMHFIRKFTESRNYLRDVLEGKRQ